MVGLLIVAKLFNLSNLSTKFASGCKYKFLLLDLAIVFKKILNRFLVVFLACISFWASAQTAHKFSHSEYLHGQLSSFKTCFDVKQYEITVRVDPEKHFISGNNIISFKVLSNFKKMQLDLFAEIKIDSIIFESNNLNFTHDNNAFFVEFSEKLVKNTNHQLVIYFEGAPRAAKNPPWDGGFVWSKDSDGKPWVGLACEGLGASCWLPCKDHLSDEADSLKMHLIVPDYLTGVSNGKLISSNRLGDGFAQYNWQVLSPINNYNITINIGNYVHLSDKYVSNFNLSQRSLYLDYYVLKQNAQKAALYFHDEVKKMLDCFETRFGTYPFYQDGYKLVETPYWGMEHQSCVSYGNDYKKNKWNFDFIIVHESAHEWFGNSLSCVDPAEMWIHESFTTYAEALYMECHYGYESYVNYLKSQKGNIENKEPMIGPYDVYFHGRKDNDIYYKGSWMLHTLRSVIDNDSTWFALLLELNFRYQKSNVTTASIIHFFNTYSKRNFSPFFKQYLYGKDIPEFDYKIVEKEGRQELHYRWRNTIKGFEMPIKMTISKDLFEFVYPSKSWQVLDLNFSNPDDFKIQSDRFLINVKKIK